MAKPSKSKPRKRYPRVKKKSLSIRQKIQQRLKSVQVWGLVILLMGISTALLWWSLFKPFPIQGHQLVLNIKPGDNYSSLIARWHQAGKVHLPWLLKLYHKIWVRDSLKVGVYEIPQGTSVAQVLAMLADADNAQMNRVLVIEGSTFKQLKNQLQRDPFVKKTILHLPNAQLLRELDIPYAHPEGLFAPDTYFFAKGETDKTILKQLYTRQQNDLAQAWQNRAPNLPYTKPYEALIMASIIEKETNLDRELNQVSGVFVRRLQLGMRLQTDPTVIYGMGDAYQGNIRKQDLRTPTPYNTYTQAGLPPTPIALPSRKAIVAAMHPDNSNNLFFVATGDGGHTFSATYEQHKQAVAAYLATLRAKGN